MQPAQYNIICEGPQVKLIVLKRDAGPLMGGDGKNRECGGSKGGC